MRAPITLIAVFALGALLAACGGDDDAGGGGDAGNGQYGTGLKLSRDVLRTTPVGASVGPWYRWNSDSCSFEDTKDHPAEYEAKLRTVESDGTFGYMHYGNSDPLGVAVSKSVEAAAEEAQMPLDIYNLKYPSRTEPRNAAQTALVKQNMGVMQANLDPALLPAFYEILEGEGCVPSIQMFVQSEEHPTVGGYWPDIGREIGDYIAKEADARGWKPEDTALVQCTDPDHGPSVNVMFETAPEQMADAGFALPEGNVFDLVCKLTESQAARKRVTDWFTSHPDFEHVAITAIDSIRMGDIINAVENEDLPDEDTILVDGQADDSSMEFVRKGQEDMTVTAYNERFGDWLVPMLQDVMVGEAVPAYVGTELAQITAETVDEQSE